MRSRGAIGSMMMAIFVLALGGCEITNDEPISSLRIRVEIPAPPAALSDHDPIIPPNHTDYYVRVSLTNPDEVFYDHDYDLGDAINLDVKGGTRVIDVEAYEVPGSGGPDISSPSDSGPVRPYPDFLPVHYVATDTLAQRTLRLSGDPTTITIHTAVDPDLGTVVAPAPYPLAANGDSILIAGCPANTRFFITVTDESWGQTFPSIMVELFQPVAIHNLPLGRGYTFKYHHLEESFTGSTTFFLSASGQEVDVSFDDMRLPEMELIPLSPLDDVAPGETVAVDARLEDGLGGYVLAPGPDDTCGGLVSGFRYLFTAPAARSCLINLIGSDCAGYAVEKTLKVPITP